MYPIYIPSKGRGDRCIAAKLLLSEGIPFKIVVEIQDVPAYTKNFDYETLLILPFINKGIAATRQWIKERSRDLGELRHWQIDDNVQRFYNVNASGKRKPCTAEFALSNAEKFVDRYSNVAIAGLKSFAFGHRTRMPYSLNQQVYCCVLVLNGTEFRYRGPACEDTDYSLQALSAGWCTILFNAFQFSKPATGKMKGGNTESYQDDGRIQRARWLERQWPGLVRITRMWDRPAQSLGHVWRKFDTPLIKVEND